MYIVIAIQTGNICHIWVNQVSIVELGLSKISKYRYLHIGINTFSGVHNIMSQGISSFCSAGGQGSELNNNLFPPCKVLLMNFCKH